MPYPCPGSSGVEQRIENSRVGGSNPPPGTITALQIYDLYDLYDFWPICTHPFVHPFVDDSLQFYYARTPPHRCICQQARSGIARATQLHSSRQLSGPLRAQRGLCVYL